MWPSWNCRASGVPDPWHISTGAIMTFSDAFSQSPGTFPLPLNRYRGRNSVTVCSRRTVARWNPISASQSADNCLMDWPSSWTGLTQIGRVPDDARLQMKECDRRGDYKRRGRGSVNSRCRSAPSDVYCLSARLDIAVSAHCSMNVSRVRPSCYWAVIQRWQLLYRCGGCCWCGVPCHGSFPCVQHHLLRIGYGNGKWWVRRGYNRLWFDYNSTTYVTNLSVVGCCTAT